MTDPNTTATTTSTQMEFTFQTAEEGKTMVLRVPTLIEIQRQAAVRAIWEPQFRAATNIKSLKELCEAAHTSNELSIEDFKAVLSTANPNLVAALEITIKEC